MTGLMLQGTGSDVGKSVLVAGLCRAFANRGLRVLPFEPQNMATNAAVTVDGGEIGRAQALQAIAARAEPVSDMNPVLIKPHAECSAQLIVGGRLRGARVEGYEMHMGTRSGPDMTRPLGYLADGRPEGTITADGRVAGIYVHGLFGLAAQRAAWLGWIGATSIDGDQSAIVDAALDEIAAALEAHLDMDGLLAVATAGIAAPDASR